MILNSKILFKIVIITINTLLLLALSITANINVHPEVLEVGYDDCSQDSEKDGIDETWYINNYDDGCKHYSHISHNVKILTYYVAEVKRSLDLTMYGARNVVEVLKKPRKHPTERQVIAIKDAVKFLKITN